MTYTSDVTVLTSETEVVDALTDGERGTVFVNETPFYATSGGQEADTGVIRTADGEFKVEDTVKLLGGKIGHVGQVVRGMIKVGDDARLEVDTQKRVLSARNHSATHLLQKALRTVLGTHVEQAGSSVNEDRLRFDFTHFSAMTPEELQKVEDMVNDQIAAALTVKVENLPIEEARKTGAQALFGEKYGDIVRVVNMGDYSIEFCGGTHVNNTSENNTNNKHTKTKKTTQTTKHSGTSWVCPLVCRGSVAWPSSLTFQREGAAPLRANGPPVAALR